MKLLTKPQIAGLLPETASRKVRLFSFGGGVQSTAVMVLQAQGRLPKPYDAFVFANVGHDSENPDTLRYLEEVSKPYMERHHIRFVQVQKTTYGEAETLVEYIYRTERSVPIPARRSNGAPGNRSCTNDFKTKVVDKWIRDEGYTHAVVALGISLDEYHRMRDEKWHDGRGSRSFRFWKKREHPLIDLRIRRAECKAIIQEAGLPIPPKSSCYFCPFMRKNEWIELKRNRPVLFEKAVALEHHINEKRGALDRDRVYLHPSVTPLEHAVSDQMQLPFMDGMDDACGGYCHT